MAEQNQFISRVEITEKLKKTEECEEVKVYGLKFYISGENSFSKTIEDISCDREQLKNFREVLQESDLSPIHIQDVIEDFIT